MNTLTIDHETLRALIEFAPKKDVRPYMRGAHIVASRRGVIGYACTGGSMLVVRIDDQPRPDGWCFAPAEWKLLKGFGSVELSTCLHDDGSVASRLELGGVKLEWRGNARQIDFDRVVPSQVSMVPAAYDPELIARLHKAGKTLGAGYGPFITPNGPECAALANYKSGKAFGVIMPMRGDLAATPPEWFTAVPASVDEAT